MLDVDQAGELKRGFRRARGSDGSKWTNAKVKKLSEGKFLGSVLDVLDGRARIIPVGVKQIAAPPKKIRSKYLKRISGGRNLVLDAVDGTRVIADATDMFPAGIDSDFRNWKADEPGQPTGKTFVDVYEMKQDATFEKMFKSLDADFGRLCFTQHQILNFVEKHKSWLREDGYGTFFPFKSHGERFVARVRVLSGGLYVDVFQFEGGGVWSADDRRRVVVPQLA